MEENKTVDSIIERVSSLPPEARHYVSRVLESSLRMDKQNEKMKMRAEKDEEAAFRRLGFVSMLMWMLFISYASRHRRCKMSSS